MKIQFNADKTIGGDQDQASYFSGYIEEKLSRFDAHITRIEVHLSDTNGKKEGKDDIQCVLEARMEGRDPIAVTSKANTAKDAVSGAVEKIKRAMDTVLGRMKDSVQ